jgi:DNA-binding response OmpR family regulator
VKLLVVEDSKHLREDLAKALRHSGHVVDVAADGEEGLWMAKECPYDTVVLDIMLPRMDGLTVLSEMRRTGIQSPVLLLTARNTVDDRVLGLREGADDYLGKPFDLAEFLARVDALCRRGHGQRSPVITAGEIELDTNSKEARRSGKPLDLTAREYSLISLLMLDPGKVFSRNEIEARLYDESGSRMSNVIDSTVYHLRNKLGTDGSEIIRTRRGQGYFFQESSA